MAFYFRQYNFVTKSGPQSNTMLILKHLHTLRSKQSRIRDSLALVRQQALVPKLAFLVHQTGHTIKLTSGVPEDHLRWEHINMSRSLSISNIIHTVLHTLLFIQLDLLPSAFKPFVELILGLNSVKSFDTAINSYMPLK